MRRIFGMIVVAVAAAQATPSAAGVYSDDLAKCLVAEADKADQAVLMQWFFAALGEGAVVKGMTSITPAERQEKNVHAAALFQRLLAEDCRAQAVTAIKYEGVGAIETSFGVLGNVAARNLMTDPAVAAHMEQFAGLLDQAKLSALLEEAGVPVAPSGDKAK